MYGIIGYYSEEEFFVMNHILFPLLFNYRSVPLLMCSLSRNVNLQFCSAQKERKHIADEEGLVLLILKSVVCKYLT